ncbi:MAG: single-stranded DNA-binding protein [Acidobacteria bacterium]|nr:single-stranded DNA-binding protein [Acidobacteriota bacterium]
MNERNYSVASIGSKIDAFLRPVLKSAGLELDFEMADANVSESDFETPDMVVRFTGPDVDLLLSNKAELLLALEHVTMEALRVPSEDHSRLSFDANDYRLLRIEELRLSAMAAAERVKRTGVPFRFNPMNSRERRVIHLALRNETELRSESLGFGPNRQVVVYPAGMASLPESAATAPARYAGREGSGRSGPPHGGAPRGGGRQQARPRGRGARR